MGKNQMHKAAQQQRHGGGGDPDAAVPDQGDGTVDVSFHSPEWHAARIAALTTERISWEDFKKKQKEEASMAAVDAENEEEAMRKYRAQLDADRAARLSKGTNNAHLKKDDSSKKRKRAEKDKKRSKDKKNSKDKKGSKEKEKKRSKDKKSKKDSSKKRRRSSPSDSSSGSGSDSEASEPKKAKSIGPVRLSKFLAS